MPFKFFDHTGDIGVELTAPDAAGLFVAAADALTETLTDPAAVEPRERARIELDAPDLDVLLADWVGELVYRFDALDWLTRRAIVRLASRSDGWHLQAEVEGEPRDPDRHSLVVLVKGMTYHGLHVEGTDGLWRARIVLDI